MSYWELEPEPWELELQDDHDGANRMRDRGRREALEKCYRLEFNRD